MNEQQQLNFFNELRNVYPIGMQRFVDKNGHEHAHPWRLHPTMIKHRFDMIKKYLGMDFDVDFTQQEIIDTTKMYVQSFGGDYSGMKTLKYFIIQKDVESGEYNSEMLNYLENMRDGVFKNNNKDWTSTII